MLRKTSQRAQTHSFDEVIPEAIKKIVVILQKDKQNRTTDESAELSAHHEEIERLQSKNNPFKVEYFKDIDDNALKVYLGEFHDDQGAKLAATNRNLEIVAPHSPRKKHLHTNELIKMIVWGGDNETQRERILKIDKRLKALEQRGGKRTPKTYQDITDHGIGQYLDALNNYNFNDGFARKELERRKNNLSKEKQKIKKALDWMDLKERSDDEFSDTLDDPIPDDTIRGTDENDTPVRNEDQVDSPSSSASSTSSSADVVTDKALKPKHGCLESLRRLFSSFSFGSKNLAADVDNSSLRRDARHRRQSVNFADGQVEKVTSTCSLRNKLLTSCVVIAAIVVSAALGYLKSRGESQSLGK